MVFSKFPSFEQLLIFMRSFFLSFALFLFLLILNILDKIITNTLATLVFWQKLVVFYKLFKNE